MIVLGIDPGSEQSGVVLWDSENNVVVQASVIINSVVLIVISGNGIPVLPDLVAIERIRGYGITAGNDTFDTCEWVGRFEQAALAEAFRVVKVPRKDVKRHLCGNTTTNDKYVRQALIDRFGAVGTKKAPGPLYGISGHMWSALAVAVTAAAGDQA